MDELKKKQKDKDIKQEIARLKKLFENLSGEKISAAEGLIHEAAFMRATLKEAKGLIDEQGILDFFEQGSNAYFREHPATKVYNTMIQRYSAVCKQIFDMLPNETSKTAKDEFIEFIKS
jgi:hypothetical protein